jgi:type VI secretion system secreted protein Hcp
MAVDMFLKLDGIQGESQVKGHESEILISSYSLGSSNASSFNSRGGGASAGKVSFQDIHFVKNVDKASAALMLHCCNGSHIKTGTLVVRKAGQQPVEYLTLTLTDVLVSSYQTGGSNGGDGVSEQISLAFAKIEVEYKPQNPDGSLGTSVLAGWDLKANLPITPVTIG